MASSSGTIKSTHYIGVSGAGRVGTVDLEDEACGDYFTDGMLFPKSAVTSQHVRDGASNTLMVGENNYVLHGWMEGAYWKNNPKQQICMASTKNVRWPINPSREAFGYHFDDPNAPPDAKRMLNNDSLFGSDHPGGAFFTFVDGHVQFKTNDLDLKCFQDLATVSGNEVICE
jgi:prepilin-type processing-associated H-X9-DG protein